MTTQAIREVIRRADMANTKPISPCADCGGQENPLYVESIDVLDEPTGIWSTGWICRRCSNRNREMELESTVRVVGCRECGGAEYAARTFTLTLRKWLCHGCVQRLRRGGEDDQALLDYVHEAILTARC